MHFSDSNTWQLHQVDNTAPLCNSTVDGESQFLNQKTNTAKTIPTHADETALADDLVKRESPKQTTVNGVQTRHPGTSPALPGTRSPNHRFHAPR